MNIDAHKARMLANGNNTGESLGNSTKSVINNLFKDSPFYRVVQIDSVDTDVRIVTKSTSDSGVSSNQKDLTFRPDTKLNIGSLVEYDTNSWLLVDFNNNDVFPVGSIHHCNSTLQLKGETTKTKTGENSFGEPIYEYVEDEPIILPCIVESTFTVLETDKPINLPEGRIKVTISYTEHDDVVIGKEFSMYGDKYEITGIDYTKSIGTVGIITINGERRV